jgi:hypothetical protein
MIRGYGRISEEVEDTLKYRHMMVFIMRRHYGGKVDYSNAGQGVSITHSVGCASTTSTESNVAAHLTCCITGARQ